MLISAPFFLFAMLAGAGGPWEEFAQAVLTFVALTLVVVPVIYMISELTGERIKKRIGRKSR